MKTFLVGIVIGLLAAIFPKLTLCVCGAIALLVVLGFIVFLVMVAWILKGEPQEERS